jgi:hypothetical protein
MFILNVLNSCEYTKLNFLKKPFELENQMNNVLRFETLWELKCSFIALVMLSMVDSSSCFF